jgi:hypothetical protein
MSKTVNELAKKVVQLPVKDRAYLAERLLASLECETAEPRSLQRLMDEAESSGFKKFAPKDWNYLRDLAKTGVTK